MRVRVEPISQSAVGMPVAGPTRMRIGPEPSSISNARPERARSGTLDDTADPDQPAFERLADGTGVGRHGDRFRRRATNGQVGDATRTVRWAYRSSTVPADDQDHAPRETAALDQDRDAARFVGQVPAAIVERGVREAGPGHHHRGAVGKRPRRGDGERCRSRDRRRGRLRGWRGRRSRGRRRWRWAGVSVASGVGSGVAHGCTVGEAVSDGVGSGESIGLGVADADGAGGDALFCGSGSGRTMKSTRL